MKRGGREWVNKTFYWLDALLVHVLWRRQICMQSKKAPRKCAYAQVVENPVRQTADGSRCERDMIENNKALQSTNPSNWHACHLPTSLLHAALPRQMCAQV